MRQVSGKRSEQEALDAVGRALERDGEPPVSAAASVARCHRS